MRVLVCGGRDFQDRQLLFNTLNNIHKYTGPITCIISGKARGADSLGEQWAKYVDVPVDPYPALWTDFNHPWSKKRFRNGLAYNPVAGPIRNQKMIDEGKPDLVVAFAGGVGTLDMLRRTMSAGIGYNHIGSDELLSGMGG